MGNDTTAKGSIGGRTTYVLCFRPVPAAALAARALLADALPACGLAGLLDTARLVATELVANAIRSGEDIRVEVYADAGELHIEVFDTAPDRPEPRDADPYDERGRGLLLVDACADAWGYRPVTGGKIVWAVIGDRVEAPPPVHGG
jgi:anti-sigma regulatory factor (Ser/Thr protein kinase)